jgi:hypothetical protein
MLAVLVDIELATEPVEESERKSDHGIFFWTAQAEAVPAASEHAFNCNPKSTLLKVHSEGSIRLRSVLNRRGC